jgi:hypothetical protein
MASRAEEFHLRALPKPCVNLSTHTPPTEPPDTKVATDRDVRIIDFFMHGGFVRPAGA